MSVKGKSWINACQPSWKKFEVMWVRFLFVSRHNFLFHVLVSFSTVSTEKRTQYCTLKIEVLFTFTISPMFEQFTRNYVSRLKCPDLSRSRQCFSPIASRLFYDGVDDDDDDGDDVTSSFGHCPESCFCVYQNSYCDCAVDDQFLKVLRCPGVGTFLHPEEKLVCPLVHCLRFLRLEKSVHRYFWREIVDVLCYFHILCLMQWVHNFVAPKFHDLLFIRS